MHGTPHIANDNERPSIVHRLKRSTRTVAHQAPARPANLERPFGKAINSSPQVNAAPKDTNGILLPFALLFFIGSIVALVYSYQSLGTPLQSLTTGVGFGWASLFLLYLSKREGRPLLRRLSMLGSLASLIAIGMTLHTGFNIHLEMGVTLCLAAGLALAVGALTQEKFPVLISVILSAMWVGNAHFEPNASKLVWLFPTFFVLQYWLSAKMRAPVALILTILTVVAWVCSNLLLASQNGGLPITLVLGILLLCGIAYNRIGKIMQDGDKPTGLLHTNIAWILGVASAIGIQFIWGTPAENLEQASGLAEDTVTMIGVALSMAITLVIIGASIRRNRSGHQSLNETIALTGIALALIVLLNNPDTILNWASTLTPMPLLTLSFVVGGLIVAASIGMIVNGARRGKSLMIMIGIIAIIAELYLAVPKLSQHSEYIYAFGYSGLFSLLFLALFAQNNINARTSRYHQYA